MKEKRIVNRNSINMSPLRFARSTKNEHSFCQKASEMYVFG